MCVCVCAATHIHQSRWHDNRYETLKRSHPILWILTFDFPNGFWIFHRHTNKKLIKYSWMYISEYMSIDLCLNDFELKSKTNQYFDIIMHFQTDFVYRFWRPNTFHWNINVSTFHQNTSNVWIRSIHVSESYVRCDSLANVVYIIKRQQGNETWSTLKIPFIFCFLFANEASQHLLQVNLFDFWRVQSKPVANLTHYWQSFNFTLVQQRKHI